MERDPEPHIAWILDQIESVAFQIQQYMSRDDVRADLYCYWEMEGNGGIAFSPMVLGRVAAMGLNLGLDIGYYDVDDATNEGDAVADGPGGVATDRLVE